MTDRMCQKWFVKLCAGDLSLDDAPRWGSPAEVDSDQIKTLIENNQCYAMQEIANILKISKSINLIVKMKNVSFISWKKLNRLFGQPSIFIQGANQLTNESLKCPTETSGQNDSMSK